MENDSMNDVMMPDISYKRGFDSNYMIIKSGESINQYDSNYKIRMLNENRIENVLRLEMKMNNGEYDYYYEISGMQPIKRLFEHREIKWDDLTGIIRGIDKAYNNAYEYMLPPKHFVLDPQFMYMDIETKNIELLYYPDYFMEVDEAMMEIAEYILDRVDHQDSIAVMMAYQLYKVIRSGTFTMKELIKITDSQTVQQSHNGCARDNQHDKHHDDEYNTEHSNYSEHYIRNGQDELLDICDEDEDLDNADCDNKHLENRKASTITKRKNQQKSLLESIFSFGTSGKALNKSPYKLTNKASNKPTIETVNKSLSETTSKTLNEIYDSRQSPNQNTEIEEYKMLAKERSDEVTSSAHIEPESYGKTMVLVPEKTVTNHILIQKGKGGEKIHKLESFPVSLGKVASLVDIPLNDPSVSKLHAQIILDGDEILIKDCNSTNGTFVNGLQLDAEESISLETGDEIRLGKIKIEYR